MDGNLVFRGPPDGSGNLVFGDADGGGGIAPVSVIIDAELPGLDTVGITLAVSTRVVLDASLPGLDGEVGLVWDANVSRGLRHEVQSHWQEGTRVHAAAAAHWQETEQLQSAAIARWQEAAGLRQASRQHWQETERLRGVLQSRYQAAVSLRAATRQHWEETERLRGVLQARYQLGISLRAAIRQHWQENERLRSALLEHWQEGMGLHNGVRSFWQEGDGVRIAMRQHWQEAMRPAAGVSPRPKPPVKVPCYDVATAANLLFEEAWTNDGHLVFVCYRKGDGPDPGETLVVPLKRIYMTVHEISAILLPGGEPVQLQAPVIESNDDGYGWTLSASGPLHLMDQLAWAGGVPKRVMITVDGIAWVFAIDPPERSRRFEGHKVQVKGSSVTSLLGSLPSIAWSNSAQRTAQQLALTALDLTGVDLDWQITDWTVPANAWSHQGTPLSAVLRIAEAAGAVVRSHRTEPKLIVAPRYKAMPWEWATNTADIRIPAQIITQDTLQPVIGPAYNAVNVIGVLGGKHIDVVRSGTTGNIRAPFITDSLITDIEAGRMRGKSVIGDSVIRFRQPITVPLLSELGLVQQGLLLDVTEPDSSWRGITRSISLSVAGPTIRQDLIVERYL